MPAKKASISPSITLILVAPLDVLAMSDNNMPIPIVNNAINMKIKGTSQYSSLKGFHNILAPHPIPTAMEHSFGLFI